MLAIFFFLFLIFLNARVRREYRFTQSSKMVNEVTWKYNRKRDDTNPLVLTINGKYQSLKQNCKIHVWKTTLLNF